MMKQGEGNSYIIIILVFEYAYRYQETNKRNMYSPLKRITVDSFTGKPSTLTRSRVPLCDIFIDKSSFVLRVHPVPNLILPPSTVSQKLLNLSQCRAFFVRSSAYCLTLEKLSSRHRIEGYISVTDVQYCQNNHNNGHAQQHQIYVLMSTRCV